MIISPENNYQGLDEWLKGKRKVFLVCDPSIRYLEGLNRKLGEVTVPLVRFSDFRPNPLYESVLDGVRRFREEGCDAVMAVGGGSAMDVAKCVRAYCRMDGDGADGAFLRREIVPGGIPFLAMPTTAGTGSEATRYAVIYYEGKKQSVTGDSLIPDTVLMDPDCLKTLPPYQKKATMCDALCHAVESFWSVNSTEESRRYSREAIRGVTEHMEGYLANTEDGRRGMLLAAHTAGKAINIAQTTAGHAMCYKITSLFGPAHGHAAMLCDRVLYGWMAEHTDRCIDPRGEAYLRGILDEIGQALGGGNAEAGAERLREIFGLLDFEIPAATEAQFAELKRSVNPDRLKNHPVRLDGDTIDGLYHEILREAYES